MRIIKFRAWDTRINKWYKSVNDPFSWGNWNSETISYTELHTPEGVVLMQFTGLRDFYEGDIVKHQNGTIGEVVFHRGKFTVKEITVRGTTFYSTLDDIGWKKIGTIYENPELITNSKTL